jgi:hypothetical protein
LDDLSLNGHGAEGLLDCVMLPTRLRGPLMENLGAGFFDLFDVVLVAEDGQEVQLRPLVASSRRGTKQRSGGRATDDPN